MEPAHAPGLHQLPEREGPHRASSSTVIRVSTRRHRPAATGQGRGPWGPAGCRGRGEQELAVEPWNVQAPEGMGTEHGVPRGGRDQQDGYPAGAAQHRGPEAMSICVVFGPVYGQSLKKSSDARSKDEKPGSTGLGHPGPSVSRCGHDQQGFGGPGRGGAVHLSGAGAQAAAGWRAQGAHCEVDYQALGGHIQAMVSCNWPVTAARSSMRFATPSWPCPR